jgi:catechol 2,3-dioxygenase-like lactoylglutathione lyase family enzyme
MVRVIVEDMPRALEFYRRLGVDIPEGSEELEHVEVKMSGLTFFLGTTASNARCGSGDANRPERHLPHHSRVLRGDGEGPRREVRGAHGPRLREPRAPYDVTPELRFAMVNDPDGNTVLLSASV